MIKKNILLLIISLFYGCIPEKSFISVKTNRVKNKPESNSVNSASISSIQIVNNQLIILGNGLSTVTNLKVTGTSLDESFSIESKSPIKIIANSNRLFSFDISKLFNLIISDANASATFNIDFSLCNATLNGKRFNCAVPVADKDVLTYDAISEMWKPRPANEMSSVELSKYGSMSGTGIRYTSGRGSETAPLQSLMNDILGINEYRGIDETGVPRTVAKILAQADTATSSIDSRGSLVFLTTSPLTTSTTEKMRITSNGNIGIGTLAPHGSLHTKKMPTI